MHRSESEPCHHHAVIESLFMFILLLLLSYGVLVWL